MKTIFSHGGDVVNFAQSLGCSCDEIIDLSSNIHFTPFKSCFDNLSVKNYPHYDELYKILSSYYGVESSIIRCFNGASAAIFSLMRELTLEQCVCFAPLYAEYKKAALAYGKKVYSVNSWESFDLELSSPCVIVVVNPSTPDGRYRVLNDKITQWLEEGHSVIIDESFLPFTSYASIIPLCQQYENLWVISSLTKFFGCAGVRVGVVIGQKVHQWDEPLWTISAYDSAFMQQIIPSIAYRQQAYAELSEAKEMLYHILCSSPLFEKVYPSDVNFFLVRLLLWDASYFQELLKPYKIMVRNCENFDFLDNRYVRIAVKNPQQLALFKEALDAIADKEQYA